MGPHHFRRDDEEVLSCNFLGWDNRIFTINVVLDGTKIWLPSSLMVQQGDEVELTLINKLDDPHGFKIEDFGVEEVVQPKAQMTVTFTASRTGAHSYICHLHPPHLGGNILVLSK